MFKFVGVVMVFAPFGIGAAMAYTVGHSGLGVLLNLAKLILTLYGALVVFCLFVLVPAALWARVHPLTFIRTIREPPCSPSLPPRPTPPCRTPWNG